MALSDLCYTSALLVNLVRAKAKEDTYWQLECPTDDWSHQESWMSQ